MTNGKCEIARMLTEHDANHKRCHSYATNSRRFVLVPVIPVLHIRIMGMLWSIPRIGQWGTVKEMAKHCPNFTSDDSKRFLRFHALPTFPISFIHLQPNTLEMNEINQADTDPYRNLWPFRCRWIGQECTMCYSENPTLYSHLTP